MNLLHVISSPRKQRSASIQVANAFIDAWKIKNPGGSVDLLNVWEIELPPFDGPALEAKYAGIKGEPLDADQVAVWKDIQALAKRFHSAEVIVFSVPMWNFGIPYRLKHLIDAISQKDVLFTFDEKGLIGMLGGRTVVVIAARGVKLGPDFPEEDFDFQSAYLATWSRMVGIRDFHTISVEKTLGGPDEDAASRAEASIKASELAQSL
ncbi:FMN-dependent NADH-azoreductase [Caballeronia sordidicola]|jgi:FMN-dependent NADH-azoreductase|uniref:FMN dependent NADH:quinone oxidoreductase n=1 Tax=Caballeronia sordidicola TaxID=196367 RepID=A0A226WYC9_CABSO|nr:NAD(P)H-dependent oxidoreductase [Caballeronia sordidicola]OXC75787.1 FMN-dependent NADH-azoreductase [Caballeronia sordidicola]